MSTLVAQTISNGTVSTSSANVIQGSAKAWVSFNGVPATPTIGASYNVSSVTKATTGSYLITFTNAFADTNYAVCGSARNTSSGNTIFCPVPDVALTTTTIRVNTQIAASNTNADCTYVYASFFR